MANFNRESILKNYDKIMHYSFDSNPLFGHYKLTLIVSKLPKDY